MRNAGSEIVLRQVAHAIVRRTPRGSLSRAAASSLARLDDHGPERITALAEREAVSQPAMTARVRRLENAGLVTRHADAEDARATRISITEQGRATLHERLAQYDTLIGEALDRLSDDDRASIAAALPALENFVRTYDFH